MAKKKRFKTLTDNVCRNPACSKDIKVSIYKGTGACSALCSKALQEWGDVRGRTELMLLSKDEVTRVQQARLMQGLPA